MTSTKTIATNSKDQGIRQPGSSSEWINSLIHAHE